MGSKEVMVTAPLLVLLYDRTFLAGSFRAALRRRWGVYVGLAATWGFLAWLVASDPGRGGTAGFGADVSAAAYAGTQVGAIARYLWLTVWPAALTFDYGTGVARGAGQIVPGALLIAALLIGTVAALRFAPRAGFLGAAFFGVLAPSSSLVPIATQTIAEHRMYLPLAAVVAGAVLGAHALVDRLRRESAFRRVLPIAAVVLVAGALGWRTVRRNVDYRSEVAIWEDTVARAPDNVRAYTNLGAALSEAGRMDEAAVLWAHAVRLAPDDPDIHSNLGAYLQANGREPEAIVHYEKALQLRPDHANAHANLGTALRRAGRAEEAVHHHEEAVRLQPRLAPFRYSLAVCLYGLGRFDEAETHLQEAVQIDPRDLSSRDWLAAVYTALGKHEQAAAQLAEALRIDPNDLARYQRYIAALRRAKQSEPQP